VAFEAIFVFLLVSVTDASGMIAPVWSLVVPLTVAVLACGQAVVTLKTIPIEMAITLPVNERKQNISRLLWAGY
jgi:hypothetical protein